MRQWRLMKKRKTSNSLSRVSKRFPWEKIPSRLQETEKVHFPKNTYFSETFPEINFRKTLFLGKVFKTAILFVLRSSDYSIALTLRWLAIWLWQMSFLLGFNNCKQFFMLVISNAPFHQWFIECWCSANISFGEISNLSNQLNHCGSSLSFCSAILKKSAYFSN